MNRYEERAQKERRATLRSSLGMGTAGVALILVVLLIVGLSNSAPPRFFTEAAIGAAVVLLIVRQAARRMKGRPPRAAEPDPKSRLHLD